MAGTDKTRAGAGAEAAPTAPTVILVRPQLGENIGASARAMLNCGLTELRLVQPRDGWPNGRAVAAASGADRVVDGARLYDSTKAAVADLNRVYATTARPRDALKTVFDARAAAADMREAAARGERLGVLFGPERAGLDNDDAALADYFIEMPLHPGFASLNLAQAVLLVGYEWFQAGHEGPAAHMPMGDTRPATKDELVGFFEHLERELDAGGFLKPEEKRPSMVRNIRNMFQRASLTEKEIRTLRGIIAGLTRLRKD